MAKKTEPKNPPTSAKRVVTKKTPAAAKAAAPAPAPAKSKAAPKARKPPARQPKKPAFSHDDVALRAYFIAEKRLAAGLPGDARHDWIEAERQLAAEAKRKPKAAPKKL
jgi:hypothetical protein